VRAALALTIEDLDLERGRIHWRAETDKTSRERWQPMPEPVREAIYVALGWRQRDRYGGPFLLYGVQRRTRGHALRGDGHHGPQRTGLAGITVTPQPWSYQAYVAQLHAAEVRAGIDPVKYKAAHAFRRGVAGDVHAMTGSEKQAADWIGDKSVKVVREAYLLEREAQLRDIADRLPAAADGVTDGE
jgi:integrase